MAEFWRALRTLKALQAEQALQADAALAAPSLRPAARPPLVHRPRPNEPECRGLPEREYLSSEPPTPGALHESAAPWLPDEAATGRHASSVPASQTNPKPHPSSTRR